MEELNLEFDVLQDVIPNAVRNPNPKREGDSAKLNEISPSSK